MLWHERSGTARTNIIDTENIKLIKIVTNYTYIDIYVYRIFTIYDIESIIGRYLNICRLSFDSLIKVKTTNTIDLMTKHLLKTTEYRLQWRSFQKIVVFDIHVITQKVIIVSWIDYSFYDIRYTHTYVYIYN